MSKLEITRIGRKKPVKVFIHEWMKYKDVNQVELANRLEDHSKPKSTMSSGTISKKLKNPEKMSVEWLAKIAHALDIDVAQLYRHPEQPRPEDLWRNADDSTKQVVIRILEAAKRAS